MDKAEEQSMQAIMAPYEHIAKMPGKGIRGKLVDAFNLWLHIDDDKLSGIKEIVDKLHNSSLIIDDIQDESKLRRSIPAAHTIFGVPLTLNSANYVYFLALQGVSDLVPADRPELTAPLLKCFTEEMILLHQGQGEDLHFRDARVIPSVERYLRMVDNKTGGLFRLTVRLMEVFSEVQLDYLPLLKLFGRYFQILDDYLNLRSDAYHVAKSFCEDITEGKYSFMVIHSLAQWTQKGDERLHRILHQHAESVDLKKYALSLMEETGSFKHTEDYLRQLYDDIRSQISRLGGNDPLQKLVHKLHNQLPVG
eukprot:gene16106-24675_t